MRIIFDMDGTIADLYGYPEWLKKLREYDASPYQNAKPMWNMEKLGEVLRACHKAGITIVVCSWLSKESTKDYDCAVRRAKKQWLRDFDFPYDEIHLVKYGTPKHRYRRPNERNVLIDDNDTIRTMFEKYNNCSTLNPSSTNIIEWLENLIAE